MKRSLSILTAAIFASAIAVPAFAQSGAPEASPAAEASPGAEANPAGSEKHSHHHHHHKKKAESGESGASGMEPSGSPSESAPH